MKLKLFVGLVASLFIATQAYAASCLISDVTIGNSQTGVSQEASWCDGPLDNNGMKDLFGNGYNTLLDPTSQPPNGIQGTNTAAFGDNGTITVHAFGGPTSGTWTLSWITNTDVTADLYVVLKSDSDYGVYLFKELVFAAPGGEYDTNTWTVSFDTSNNGHFPELNELALIVVKNVNPVPEPATMLLFGTGLLGLAGISRRKK